jgi:hypothetical protein
MEILSFLSKKHISGAFRAEVRLLRTLFNHYEISRLGKPWETAMAEGENFKNPRLKIFYAVFLSFIDRVLNRIQRPKKLQGT